jgi:hypothetical protein
MAFRHGLFSALRRPNRYDVDRIADEVLSDTDAQVAASVREELEPLGASAAEIGTVLVWLRSMLDARVLDVRTLDRRAKVLALRYWRATLLQAAQQSLVPDRMAYEMSRRRLLAAIDMAAIDSRSKAVFKRILVDGSSVSDAALLSGLPVPEIGSQLPQAWQQIVAFAEDLKLFQK